LDPNLQFTYPKASIRTSKLQKKPSALKREHPALENIFKIVFYFCGSFLHSWIWIKMGSGSATLVATVQYKIFVSEWYECVYKGIEPEEIGKLR
jgi:hypothetical protein